MKDVTLYLILRLGRGMNIGFFLSAAFFILFKDGTWIDLLDAVVATAGVVYCTHEINKPMFDHLNK